MIIDELIAVLFSVFGVLLEGLAIIVVPVINLFALGLELILGLVFSGFKLGRLEPYKRDKENGRSNSSKAVMLFWGGIIAVTLFVNFVWYRDITFISTDGQSLPFASVVIYTNDAPDYERTESDGDLRIPRFGVNKIEIIDKRYHKKIWEASEITTILIAERTVFGAGLDKLANKLLKRANK